MKSKSPAQIFLSYSVGDLERVSALYQELSSRGLKIWFDKVDLTLGEWLPQIEKAIARSGMAVFCLSRKAIDKLTDSQGMQDQEIALAYRIASRLPPNDFSIVPVRLEDCGRGDHRLTTSQQFDLFPDWNAGVERLALALGGMKREDSWKYRAETEMLRGDFVNAYASLRAFEAVASETYDSAFFCGVSFFNMRRYSEAMVHFERAARIGGLDARIAFATAQTHFALKQYGECIRAAEAGLKHFPENNSLQRLHDIAWQREYDGKAFFVFRLLSDIPDYLYEGSHSSSLVPIGSWVDEHTTLIHISETSPWHEGFSSNFGVTSTICGKLLMRAPEKRLGLNSILAVVVGDRGQDGGFASAGLLKVGIERVDMKKLGDLEDAFS